jgi:RimJ/RimL family protein N-acetyltransferase
MPIRTERLDLVAATLAHLDAEMESPARLGHLLGAEIPASWPPGEYDRSAMVFFRDRLSEGADAVGWYTWYAMHRPLEGGGRVLVGAGGYLGPPGADGTVEVGYSIAPEFEGRAFATEMVEALVSRALGVAGVVRVVAHTKATNTGSIKVLERCGFTTAGAGNEPDTVRYERAV